MEKELETATLAGGCFWCMQPPFDGLPGVVKTTVGYTGGRTKNPTYEDICEGNTGHVEAVEVVFDPAKTSFAQVLEAYWRSIDPTDAGGQFFDIHVTGPVALPRFAAEPLPGATQRLAEATQKLGQAARRRPGWLNLGRSSRPPADRTRDRVQ